MHEGRMIDCDDGSSLDVSQVETVMIVPSFRCNGRCEFCQSDVLVTDVRSADVESQLRRIESAASLLRPRVRNDASFVLSGGEVSTLRHLPDIIRSLTASGVRYTGIMTNGRNVDRLMSLPNDVTTFCLSRHHPDDLVNATAFGRKRPWLTRHGIAKFRDRIRLRGGHLSVNSMVSKNCVATPDDVVGIIDLFLGCREIRFFAPHDPIGVDVPSVGLRRYADWFKENSIPEAAQVIVAGLALLGVESEIPSITEERLKVGIHHGSSAISFRRHKMAAFFESERLSIPPECLTIAPDGSIRLGMYRCDRVLISAESIDELIRRP